MAEMSPIDVLRRYQEYETELTPLLLGLLTMAISISGVPARYLDLVAHVLAQLRALTPT